MAGGEPVEITWEPRVYVSRDRRLLSGANDDGVVQRLEGLSAPSLHCSERATVHFLNFANSSESVTLSKSKGGSESARV